MKPTQTITSEQFCQRLANLCLRSGLAGMPKDETDQHILLKSATLLFKSSGPFSEKEINETLQVWLTQVCAIQFFDRVTLRRWLVDTGYLTRSSDGATYQVIGSQPGRFEPGVDQIDLLKTLQDAREEMERRKQAFLEKAKGK